MTDGVASNGVNGQVVRRALRAVLVVSALWTVFLLGTHVDAPTLDPDRSDCGASSLSINSAGSSIGGGERRVDQDAFDKACVDRAKERIRLSFVSGSLFVLASAGVLIDGRRRRTPRRDDGRVVGPFTGSR